MGIIPYADLTLGKALYVIERKADFLNGTVDASVISSVTGQYASSIEQSLTMTNNVLSGGAYTGGFETIPFAMRNETGVSKDVVMAASLTLNSLMASTPVQQTLTFTDGANSIRVRSDSTAMLGTNTSVQSMIDGETTNKTLCINHNFSGNSQKRYCPTLRVDKGRGKVEFYVNDGLYGTVALSGLDKFGLSKFVYAFSASTQDAALVWVRQVVLRLEC